MEKFPPKPLATAKPLTFGDLISATYRAWGPDRANGLVRLAVNAHLVVFRGQQRLVITEEKQYEP
jgi:hypothetical protein